jgi:methylated-DNA-[protein]-cysteine S-methyltransferase
MNAPLIAQTRIPTPLGTMTAAATGRGVAGLWFDGQRHHPGALAAPLDEQQPHLARLRRELERYWRDPGVRFEVALDPQGTPFQRAVWERLRELGPTQRTSYGELARQLGRPQAARAVGAAVGRNPISLVVPCHRVLGRDGALTGYAGGLERKRWLLQHEAAAPQRAAA